MLGSIVVGIGLSILLNVLVSGLSVAPFWLVLVACVAVVACELVARNAGAGLNALLSRAGIQLGADRLGVTHTEGLWLEATRHGLRLDVASVHIGVNAEWTGLAVAIGEVAATMTKQTPPEPPLNTSSPAPGPDPTPDPLPPTTPRRTSKRATRSAHVSYWKVWLIRMVLKRLELSVESLRVTVLVAGVKANVSLPDGVRYGPGEVGQAEAAALEGRGALRDTVRCLSIPSIQVSAARLGVDAEVALGVTAVTMLTQSARTMSAALHVHPISVRVALSPADSPGAAEGDEPPEGADTEQPVPQPGPAATPHTPEAAPAWQRLLPHLLMVALDGLELGVEAEQEQVFSAGLASAEAALVFARDGASGQCTATAQLELCDARASAGASSARLPVAKAHATSPAVWPGAVVDTEVALDGVSLRHVVAGPSSRPGASNRDALAHLGLVLRAAHPRRAVPRRAGSGSMPVAPLPAVSGKVAVHLSNTSVGLLQGTHARPLDCREVARLVLCSVELRADRGKAAHSLLGFSAAMSNLYLGLCDAHFAPKPTVLPTEAHVRGRVLSLVSLRANGTFDQHTAPDMEAPLLDAEVEVASLRVAWCKPLDALCGAILSQPLRSSNVTPRSVPARQEEPPSRPKRRLAVKASATVMTSCVVLLANGPRDVDGEGCAVMFHEVAARADTRGGDVEFQFGITSLRSSVLPEAWLQTYTAAALGNETALNLVDLAKVDVGGRLTRTQPPALAVTVAAPSVALDWNATVHMNGFTLVQEATARVRRALELRKAARTSRQHGSRSAAAAAGGGGGGGASLQRPDAPGSAPPAGRAGAGLNLLLDLELAHVSVHGTMPSGVTAQFVLEGIKGTAKKQRAFVHVRVPVREAAFVLESRRVVTVSNLQAELTNATTPDLEATKLLFREAGSKSFGPVRTVGVLAVVLEADGVRFVHHWGHDFGAALEDVKTAVKILKKLHQGPRRPRSREHGRPDPHVVVKVREVRVVFEDDPFEVRLASNHELLGDEVREQAQRERVLSTRIAQQHDSLAEARITELHQSLKAKSAEIYIRRARAFAAEAPPRTELFTLVATNVRLVALSDEGICSTAAIEDHIRELDRSAAYPDAGLDFSLLVHRKGSVAFDSLGITLRDYYHDLVSVGGCSAHGALVITEVRALASAERVETVRLGRHSLEVVKGMSPIKVYHDLQLAARSIDVAFGPCYEPVLNQLGLVVDLLTPKSRDPSPPLPWFDKVRLLRHGPLRLRADALRFSFLSGPDPRLDSELLLVEVTPFALDFPTASRLRVTGDTRWSITTASKFNQCPLFDFPALDLEVSWVWHGDGHKNHHRVFQHAPRPTLAPDHDSFRQLRSSQLEVTLALAVAPSAPLRPTALFYANTLRWLKRLSVSLGAVHPIKKGTLYYATPPPPKPSLGVHMKALNLHITCPELVVAYYNSYTRDIGLWLSVEAPELSAKYLNKVQPLSQPIQTSNELIRRKELAWEADSLSVEITNVLMYALKHPKPREEGRLRRDYLVRDIRGVSQGPRVVDEQVEAFQLLLSERIHYTATAKRTVQDPMFRFQSLRRVRSNLVYGANGDEQPLFDQKCEVDGLRFGWNVNTRLVCRTVWQTFVSSRELKFDLSGDAVLLSTQSSRPVTKRPATEAPALERGSSLLHQLLEDSQTKFLATSDAHGGEGGEGAAQAPVVGEAEEDVISNDIIFEFRAPQVAFRGVETPEYLTMASTAATIKYRQHAYVWRNGKLDCKQSYLGSFLDLQLFSSSEGDNEVSWVPAGCISAGGPASLPLYMTRIVTPCPAQFSYSSFYHDNDLVHTHQQAMLSQWHPTDHDLQPEQLVDAIFLSFPDLQLTTTAEQWNALNDVMDNILFVTDSAEQESIDRLETLKYKSQLRTQSEASRLKPVQDLQAAVRRLLGRNGELEQEIVALSSSLAGGGGPGGVPPEDGVAGLVEGAVAGATAGATAGASDGAAAAAAAAAGGGRDGERYQEWSTEETLSKCEEEWGRNKELLQGARRDLHLRIQSLRESALGREDVQANLDTSSRTTIRVQRLKWILVTSAEKQPFLSSNVASLQYSRLAHLNGSGENRFELGDVDLINHFPDCRYRQVVTRHESSSTGAQQFDHGLTLRVYSREGAPVGGIPVKEHFEVNAVPLAVQMSFRLYKALRKYFFAEEVEEGKPGEQGELEKQRKRALRSSRRRRNLNQEVDEMKARAQRNRTFIYVKIPSATLSVSYKGESDKNRIANLHNMVLTLPTFEYHNRTCTWLDLTNQLQSDSVGHIINHLIKHKVGLRKAVDDQDESAGRTIVKQRDNLLGKSASQGLASGKGRLKGLLGKLQKASKDKDRDKGADKGAAAAAVRPGDPETPPG